MFNKFTFEQLEQRAGELEQASSRGRQAEDALKYKKQER